MADPAIPITCTCFFSLKPPPPVPETPVFLRLLHPAAPQFPAVPSASAASRAPPARQKPVAHPVAARFARKLRAPSAHQPPKDHSLEIHPAQSRARLPIFRFASNASARDPPDRASSHDLPELVSNSLCPIPTAFRWWPPAKSCNHQE